ncbi:hypothetical protein GCM10023065_04920 [Microbacterium laevaniformans]|nr:hypothetical protein GCM10017578_04930 [Microbacterium laevaniformans]
MGRAARVGVSGATACTGADDTASTTVPHCWHSPHRPTHFALVQPHSVQRYALVVAVRLDAMHSG